MRKRVAIVLAVFASLGVTLVAHAQFTAPTCVPPNCNPAVIQNIATSGTAQTASINVTGSAKIGGTVQLGTSSPVLTLATDNLFYGNVGSGSANGSLLLLQNNSVDRMRVLLSGQQQLPLGSVAAPSYSFIGDTNTGLYSSAADNLNFATGGISRLQIDAVGAVTIPGTLNVTGSFAAASFSGVGTSLTALNATNLTSGTVADARLSSNVPLRSANNVWTGTNAFSSLNQIGQGLWVSSDIVAANSYQRYSYGYGIYWNPATANYVVSDPTYNQSSVSDENGVLTWAMHTGALASPQTFAAWHANDAMKLSPAGLQVTGFITSGGKQVCLKDGTNCPAATMPGNVAYKDGNPQTFTGVNTFSANTVFGSYSNALAVGGTLLSGRISSSSTGGDILSFENGSGNEVLSVDYVGRLNSSNDITTSGAITAGQRVNSISNLGYEGFLSSDGGSNYLLMNEAQMQLVHFGLAKWTLDSNGRSWQTGLATFNGGAAIGNQAYFQLTPTTLASLPAGSNGSMYYDSGTNKFMCFAGGAWGSCTGAISGTVNYVPRYTPNGTTLGNSLIQDNGTGVGVGSAPLAGSMLYVSGNASVTGTLTGNTSIAAATGVSGVAQNTGTGVAGSVTANSGGTNYGVSGSAFGTAIGYGLFGQYLGSNANGYGVMGSGPTGVYGSSTSGIGGYFSSNGTQEALRAQATASPWNALSVIGNSTLGSLSTHATSVNGTFKLGSILADPTGANGMMFYSTGTSKFRCFEGGAWKDCITPSAVGGSGTANYLPKFTGANTVANSSVFDTGSAVGIGTTAPAALLETNTTAVTEAIRGSSKGLYAIHGIGSGGSNNYGVYGESPVFGIGGTGTMYGVYGNVTGGYSSGTGVLGEGNMGVEGVGNSSLGGVGVYGNGDYGVYGVGQSYAGYFSTYTPSGVGVYGSGEKAFYGNGQSFGGYFTAQASGGIGVYAKAFAPATTALVATGNVGFGTPTPDGRFQVLGGNTLLDHTSNHPQVANYANADLVLGDNASGRAGYGGSGGSNLMLQSSDKSTITALDEGNNLGQISYQNLQWTIGENIGWGNQYVSMPGTLGVGTAPVSYYGVNAVGSSSGGKFMNASTGAYAALGNYQSAIYASVWSGASGNSDNYGGQFYVCCGYNSNTGLYVYAGGPSNWGLTISNGGAQKPGGGGFSNYASDRRTKKDVSDFTDGLDVIRKIRPVNYSYNGLASTTDDGKRFVGVIAQEAQTVVPYMVGTRKDFLHPGDTEKTDILTFDESDFTWISINAIKTLDLRIDGLEAKVGKIDALDAKVQTLEGRIEAMQKEIDALKSGR